MSASALSRLSNCAWTVRASPTRPVSSRSQLYTLSKVRVGRSSPTSPSTTAGEGAASALGEGTSEAEAGGTYTSTRTGFPESWAAAGGVTSSWGVPSSRGETAIGGRTSRGRGSATRAKGRSRGSQGRGNGPSPGARTSGGGKMEAIPSPRGSSNANRTRRVRCCRAIFSRVARSRLPRPAPVLAVVVVTAGRQTAGGK